MRDYIARFNQENVAVRECSIPIAIFAFKRGLLPDGGLYKELTMYPCKTMEDVLSRAWTQVKWEEDVASVVGSIDVERCGSIDDEGRVSVGVEAVASSDVEC